MIVSATNTIRQVEHKNLGQTYVYTITAALQQEGTEPNVDSRGDWQSWTSYVSDPLFV